MVKVDVNQCIGCGACAAVAPNVFELKDGKARVKNQKNKEQAKKGADTCPVQAISV